MAFSAVYDTAQANRLVSVGEVIGTGLPANFVVKVCTFTDATPLGGRPDFERHVWNPATQEFNARPAIVRGPIYQAATVLIAKDPTVTPWTNVEMQTALRILLAGMRDLVT